MNTVPVEYIGTRTGRFTIWGPETGRSYRVSIYKPVIMVDVQDAPGISARMDFRAVVYTSRVAPPSPGRPTRGAGPRMTARAAAQRAARGPFVSHVDDRGTSRVA